MPRTPKTTPPRFEGEVAAWAAIGAGWRQLFGSFGSLGFSLEWHDFNATEPIDWARSFHPGSVELCLNLSGQGSVSSGNKTAHFANQSAGFYRQGQAQLSAVRTPGQTHQFITVEFRPDFLHQELGESRDFLHPLIQTSLDADTQPAISGVSQPEPLTSRQRDLVMALRQPPVLAGAQRLWYGAKVRELMSEFFFAPLPILNCSVSANSGLPVTGWRPWSKPSKRPDSSPFAGSHCSRGRLQPVLLEPDLFQGNGSNHSPVPAAVADGEGGHLAAVRFIQRDRSGLGSGLFQPQPF